MSVPVDSFAELTVERVIYVKVEGKVYSISEPALRLSEPLNDMINSVHVGSTSEGSKENPISLDSVSGFEFECFLRILSARQWDGPPSLDHKGWGAALHVATMYGFKGARAFIIKQIDLLRSDQIDPFSRLHLAAKCQVGKWIHPAYAALCVRPEPLTAVEGETLGLITFAALCKVREDIRVVTPKACNHGNMSVPTCMRCSAWYNSMAGSALYAVKQSLDFTIAPELFQDDEIF